MLQQHGMVVHVICTVTLFHKPRVDSESLQGIIVRPNADSANDGGTSAMPFSVARLDAGCPSAVALPTDCAHRIAFAVRGTREFPVKYTVESSAESKDVRTAFA